MHVPSLHLPRVHVRRSGRDSHDSQRASVTHVVRTQEERGLRVARSIVFLVVVATTLFAALWTLASLGYADAGWWPAVVILAMSAVAALGAWVVYWIDR